MTAVYARCWALDPSVVFLNHGSFGATPTAVLEAQQRFREQMEAEPVRFFVRELPALVDEAREVLAAFVGASPHDLVFVPNVTTAVNAVLRSLPFGPGDELLTTDHEYNACRNVLDFVAARSGARVVTAPIPFPLDSGDEVVDALRPLMTPRVKLLLVDHVTSPTGMVLPVARIVREARDLGIPVMVDGAHAPGMVPLDLTGLGADYYGANCHKWICAPKGAGFLVVRRSRRAGIRPVVVSHGANALLQGRSRFHAEFDHTGTADPSAWLSVPAALRFMGSLLPGGWDALMDRNRALTVQAREILCGTLGVDAPCPASMLGAMAAVHLPDGRSLPPQPPTYTDPLQDELLVRRGIEVPVVCWPGPPRRLIRVSAQLYNDVSQYRALGEALQDLL